MIEHGTFQGGYAIWWVRIPPGTLTESSGYRYNAAANELTQKVD